MPVVFQKKLHPKYKAVVVFSPFKIGHLYFHRAMFDLGGFITMPSQFMINWKNWFNRLVSL